MLWLAGASMLTHKWCHGQRLYLCSLSMLLPIEATVDAVPSFGPMSLWVTCLIRWLKLLTKRSETKPKTFGRLQNSPRFATTLDIFELLWSRIFTKVMALQCCAHLMIEMHRIAQAPRQIKSSALPSVQTAERQDGTLLRSIVWMIERNTLQQITVNAQLKLR